MNGRQAAAMKPVLTEAEIRRVLLEHRFLLSADALRAKWQISRATLREWKRTVGFENLSVSLRELTIAALANGRTTTLAALAAWADYQDHCPYSEAEMRAIVSKLVAEGIAAWEGENEVRYAPSDARRAARFIF